MMLLRFCNVLAAETYDCSLKIKDIVEYKYVSIRKYFKKRKTKKEIRARMNHCNSYAEWKACAEEFDKINDVRIWKDTQESNHYDWEYVKTLTQVLYETRIADDYVKIMRTIRANAMRNISNILNAALYSKSYIGTKHLIEDFQKEVYSFKAGLHICLPESKLPKNKKIEFFAETRHAFGRTALIFSGGGNIGLYHHGVIKALYEERLLPRIVAGSSAGSIFAAFFCVRKMEELPFIFNPKNIKLDAFHRKNQKYSFIRKVARLFTEGYLLDISVIRDFMRENIGDVTFQEAYDRTGWILNITVTGYGEHDGYRLLNYLTAPDVLIWSAVCASCGIPYIYGPVDLFCKNENDEIIPYVSGNRKFVDGSIGADLPMQNLSEMFNVNYFVVSQTDFWIVPFLNHSEHHRHSKRTILYRIWERIKDLIASELRHRVNQFTLMGVVPQAATRYFNLITQQYSGNVTIWPRFALRDLRTLLVGPTTEMLRNCLIHGARRTYPSIHKIFPGLMRVIEINRIASTLIIERALERNYLKARGMMEKPMFLNEIIENDYDNKEVLTEDEVSFMSSEALNDGMSQSSFKIPKNGWVFENKRCRVSSFNVPRSISAHGIRNLDHDLEIKEGEESPKILNHEKEIIC